MGRPKRDGINDADIMRMWTNGLGTHRIAKKLGCSPYTVLRRLYSIKVSLEKKYTKPYEKIRGSKEK